MLKTILIEYMKLYFAKKEGPFLHYLSYFFICLGFMLFVVANYFFIDNYHIFHVYLGFSIFCTAASVFLWFIELYLKRSSRLPNIFTSFSNPEEMMKALPLTKIKQEILALVGTIGIKRIMTLFIGVSLGFMLLSLMKKFITLHPPR